MTDDHMDARLRAAGERWRTANDTSPGVDVAATVAAHEPDVIAPTSRRPRHWGLFASAAVLAAALVVGGAFALRGGNGTSTRPNTDNAGLVGTVWELVGYNDGPDLRDSSAATFYIDKDGQLVADDSCAVVGGKAQVGSGQLAVTDQVVRYRSCTDTVGEMVFTNGGTKVLDGTADYQIDGNALTISRAGTTMHFVAAPAGVLPPTLDVPTFVGAHWKLVKAVDANGKDVPITGDIPFFVDDSGKLTASDGCNGLSGTVSGVGPLVTIEPGPMTQVGCPTGPVVDAVLIGRVQEQVLDATLTLHKAGAGELTYQWVPAETSANDPTTLDGKTWRLTSVAGAPAVSEAQLKIAGTVYTANDGCEDFTGHVSVESGSIALTGVPDIVEPSGSGAGCSQEQVNQATTIDSLLSSGGLWAIRDANLVIWDGSGAQAFALVFTTGSVPPPSTNPAAALIGKTWYLRKVGASLVSLPVPNVSVVFNRHGGFTLGSSCGTEVGTVTFRARIADFSGLHAVDWHSCPYDPRNKYYVDVARFFDESTAWRIDKGQLGLTFLDATVTFGRTPPTGQSGTSGLPLHKWILDNRETGNSGMSYDWTSGNVAPYLSFDGLGRFTGKDTCVRLSGNVVVHEATLSFTHVHRDLALCRAPATHYLDHILTTDVAWTASHGELRLTAHGVTLGFIRP